jgi:hypothetical protein
LCNQHTNSRAGNNKSSANPLISQLPPGEAKNKGRSTRAMPGASPAAHNNAAQVYEYAGKTILFVGAGDLDRPQAGIGFCQMNKRKFAAR